MKGLDKWMKRKSEGLSSLNGYSFMGNHSRVVFYPEELVMRCMRHGGPFGGGSAPGAPASDGCLVACAQCAATGENAEHDAAVKTI
jgi:hypothetical protein